MKTKELANLLTKKNGGKKESIVGNERESVGHLSDIIFEEGDPIFLGGVMIGVNSDTVVELYKNGKRRKKK